MSNTYRVPINIFLPALNVDSIKLIKFSDDFVIPSWIEFIGRIIQLLLATAALTTFLGLDLNPQEKCSADNGLIASLIALIAVIFFIILSTIELFPRKIERRDHYFVESNNGMRGT